MILRSIKYREFVNKPQQWILEEFILGKINLIVGKNATGKTRTLNVINNLANLISGEKKLTYSSGDSELTFSNNKKEIKYCLSYEDVKIYKEELHINNKQFLKRGKKGIGKIYAEKLKQDIDFQTPENELTSVARRDTVQHSFFEEIYQWGKSIRFYLFGTQLGKDHLAVFVKDLEEKEINIKETNKVVAFLRKGIDRYGDDFINKILHEMELIGYKLTEIGVRPIPGIKIVGGPMTQLEGIYVIENNLESEVFQNDMSQGMFRALSLLIQLNFSQFENLPGCILIDDIGEGLDFERSSSLIKLLIEKSKESSIQLIMATNNRFVMNNVPLEYWSVIQRQGNRCKIFNSENSEKIFDDFGFTGLSNFDFLATEFYLKGFNNK